jgi:hypothetical protein
MIFFLGFFCCVDVCKTFDRIKNYLDFLKITLMFFWVVVAISTNCGYL